MIDLKDKKLIYELDLDSRQSIRQLSKKIGLSQEATRYRIQRLIKNGVIKKFVAYLNFNKLGFFGYSIYCRYNSITENKKKKFQDYLKNRENVYWVAEYGGRFDLAFSILASTPEECDEVLTDILNNYSSYLTNLVFITKLKPHKYPKKYLINRRLYEVEKNNKSYILKDIEKDILRILTKNSRTTSVEISEKIKKPLSTVIYTIKKLEKEKLIGGYTISLEPEKIGYQSFQLNVSLQNINNGRLKDILDYCKDNKNIIFAIKTLGDWNFEIIYEIENAKKMQECILDLRNRFQEIIKDIELLNLFEDYIKLDHYPFK